MKRLTFVWVVAIFFMALTACGGGAAPTPAATRPKPTATFTLTPVPISTLTPTPTPTASPSPTPTVALSSAISMHDKASFAGETYRDYAIVRPGQTFIKTWRLTNVGTNPWNSKYFLHREAVQGHPLAAVEVVPLPHEVPPGKTVEISVKMTAPQKMGIYSERWSLRDPQGKIVPVNGGRYIWVIVRSCSQGEPCPSAPTPVAASLPVAGGNSVTVHGITLRLLNFRTRPGEADASVCIVNPPTWRHSPDAPTELFLDNKRIDISGENFIRPGCYVIEFPVNPAEVKSAKSIKLVIGQIRSLAPPDAYTVCKQKHDELIAHHPGLDFTCSNSRGFYYTNLKVPAGMTRQQADKLIMDAIEGAVYGPWVFKVR